MIFKKRNETASLADAVFLAKKLNIEPKLAEVLIFRGFDNEEKIKEFLNPEDIPMNSPFLLSGIKDAVARINRAIEHSETVVIYSDYDADGVCSAGMLYRYLLSRGLTAAVYLPSRHSDGYGLHTEAIEMLAEEYCPDLIITCDCGISAKEEAEYIMDLGIDLIITDHHEAPENIPQCTVINPKLNPEYPCPSLCGAGVVLKLIHAMSGLDAALSYIDICAIATIADLVPLSGENRTITALGLEKLNRNPVLGLGLMKSTLGLGAVTAGDVAFKISPRINAAGRIGDARRALTIMTSDDKDEISSVIDELNCDNDKRKILCDSMYEEAVNAITCYDLINKRAIILKNDSWEKGIIGIVCARVSGEFRRPTFLLAKSNDVYKATVRGIEGINIYELLNAHSNFLTDFGGHSQAAGFSILPENIAPFADSVNEYLKKNYPDELFLPNAYYDATISEEEMSIGLARQIEMLEPFGNSNPRPMFLLDVNNLNVGYMKNREHLNVTIPEGAAMVAFKCGEYKELLKSETAKTLLLEIEVNRYRNQESLKVNIRGVGNGVISKTLPRDLCECQRISRLAYKNKPAPYSVYNDVRDVLGTGIYGTYIIADTPESYFKFVESAGDYFFINEYFSAAHCNNYNRLVLAPRLNTPLNFYERIIFLDRPYTEEYIGYVAGLGCANIFVPDRISDLPEIDVSREILGKYYGIIKDNQRVFAADFYDYADVLSVSQDIKISQLMIAVLIFSELGIIKISKKPYTITMDNKVKNELTNSRLYNMFLQRKK